MGTFIVRPTTVVSGGIPLNDMAGPDVGPGWYMFLPLNLLLPLLQNTFDIPVNYFDQCSIFSASSPASFSDTLRVGLIGASIYLDDSPTPVDINSLPPGFTINSASVRITIDTINQPPSGGFARFFLQQQSGNNGALNTTDFPYSIPITMVNLVGNGIGLEIDLQVNNAGEEAIVFGIANLRVEGIYTLGSFQFSTNSVQIGDEVTITGPDVNDIISIGIIAGGNTFTADIIEQSPDGLTFVIPSGFGRFTTPLTIEIIATTFDGTTSLGTLQVLFIDASGIYTLVKNKRNDSIYYRIFGQTGLINVPGFNAVDGNDDENNVDDISGVQGLVGIDGSKGNFSPSNYYAEELIPELTSDVILPVNYSSPFPVGNAEVKMIRPLADLGFIGG